MGFSQQEYWSGLPFPPPGDLPDLCLLQFLHPLQFLHRRQILDPLSYWGSPMICIYMHVYMWGSPVAQQVKNLSAMQELQELQV